MFYIYYILFLKNYFKYFLFLFKCSFYGYFNSPQCNFLIIFCLSLVMSRFKFSFYMSWSWLSLYFNFSLYFPNPPRFVIFFFYACFYFLLLFFFKLFVFLQCPCYLNFLSTSPFQFTVIILNFFRYFLNPQCF